jgi:hypothetical protein
LQLKEKKNKKKQGGGPVDIEECWRDPATFSPASITTIKDRGIKYLSNKIF